MRQSAILDPQGAPSAELTTLCYDFADGYLVPAHFHEQDQLVFACQGVMTIRTERGIWVVPPLRAVWIPAKEAHAITMAGVVSMRTLYFVPGLARRVARKCFVLNVSPLFRELILHACTKPAWKKRFTGDRRIIEVLLDQLRSAKKIPLRLPEPTDARAARIVAILLADPGDARPLAKLCRQAGGSKRTIERVFLEETGMTFGKWRQQLRLFHGLRLLAAGENVTVAALESGYQSPSAFISVFKKALGQTPARYLSSRLGAHSSGIDRTRSGDAL